MPTGAGHKGAIPAGEPIELNAIAEYSNFLFFTFQCFFFLSFKLFAYISFSKVFVAGWGLMRSPDNTDLDPCATNQYGPKKFAKCFASASNPGGRIRCSRSPPPNHPLCREFFHSVELDAFVDIAIVENVSCYPEKHAAYGWCRTKPDRVASDRDWGFCFYACQNAESRKGSDQLRVFFCIL